MIALAAATLAAVFAGCAPKQDAPSEASGRKLLRASDIDPTHELKGTAIVTSAGLKRPMEISSDFTDQEFIVTLQTHGGEYDEEVYKSTDAAFYLHTGAGESYEEPIPLLKFPMTVGDSWQWSGDAVASDEPSPAKASIETAEEQVYVCGVAVQAVRVKVTVTISPQPNVAGVTREMTFYFAPKRGLFKRAWGNTSSREPDCP